MLLRLRPSSSQRVVTTAASVVLLSFATRGQNTNDLKIDQGSSEMLRSADIAFAMNAAQDGVAAARMAMLAAERASSAEVKAFGQQVVDDCTKANDDLKSVVEKKGMRLPSDMKARQYATYATLKKLSGPAFDRAYLKARGKNDQEGVKAFQREANRGKDEDMKGFASRTLPVLETHLHEIRSIQSNMQRSGSATK